MITVTAKQTIDHAGGTLYLRAASVDAIIPSTTGCVLVVSQPLLHGGVHIEVTESAATVKAAVEAP
jgi:hypothetical protein